MKLLEKYLSHYVPLVEDFCKEIDSHPELNLQKIPEPFFPEFGEQYEHSALKVVIIGRDTYGWGKDIPAFVQRCSKEGARAVLSDDMKEFRDLDFVNWTKGKMTRYAFWGFTMYFLAALYGVKDWQLLKRGKFNNILRSFAWGNTNTVELWDQERHPTMGCNYEGWKFAKESAAKRFDNLSHILETLIPDVVIVMSSTGLRSHFLANCPSKLLKREKDIEIYKINDTFVFAMPHPNYMRFHGGADYFASTIRTFLLAQGYSVEMPEFSKMREESCELKNFLIARIKAKTYGHSREAIAAIATELGKQNAFMEVPLLAEILNAADFRTTYGTPFQGGRGCYRMLAHAYQYYVKKEPDISEAIAVAFTKPNGCYAYNGKKASRESDQ